RRAGQRLGAPLRLPGNLHPPVGEIVGDLEVDRGELDPAHLLDQLREAGGPAAGLTAPDRLNGLALTVVGSLVDEEPHRGVDGLAGPDVPFKAADSHYVERVERDVAVVSLADVPGEDAVALPFVWCLGESADTGDPAPADVEPVAAESPARNLGHRFLLGLDSGQDPFTPQRADQVREGSCRSPRNGSAISSSASHSLGGEMAWR